MKTCVIIPSHNEAATIGRLVRKVAGEGLTVLVVDDGSTDNTSQAAKDSGAVTLKNQLNEGKGASLITGFNYAVKSGFDAVVTMDGDGQHLPEDIPRFIASAERSKSGIFVGNRMLNVGNMPLLRRATNKFMSWLISGVARQDIPDSQCGFRLVKREVLERLTLKSARFEIESEMLIKAARLGFTIESVPIKTVYTGGASHINPVIDTLRFIKFFIEELWSDCHSKEGGA
ncbi:MAG: glycosyltransferase family 2 protein [Candidatus Omnitrophica bacterium]|nr:glycosyltransferase family 2 protein [Candidatus Omnitrophota bacterium]